METRVVGQRVKRYDGMAHVTGETRFVDDVIVPGTQTVKALRSPVIKGKIKKLDTSAAEAMPGVAGVITAEDVPCNAYGLVPDAWEAFQTGEYFGQHNEIIIPVWPFKAIMSLCAIITALEFFMQMLEFIFKANTAPYANVVLSAARLLSAGWCTMQALGAPPVSRVGASAIVEAEHSLAPPLPASDAGGPGRHRAGRGLGDHMRLLCRRGRRGYCWRRLPASYRL